MVSPPLLQLPLLTTSGGFHPYYFHHFFYYQHFFHYHHLISGPRAPSRRRRALPSLTTLPGGGGASPPPQRLPNTSGDYHPHYFYHHFYYDYRYYFYHHHHISGPRAPSRRHWAQSSLTASPGEVELFFLYMCTCVLLSFLAFGPHRGGARPAVAFCLLGGGRAVYNCTFSSFSSCARSRAPHRHSHPSCHYWRKQTKIKKT